MPREKVARTRSNYMENTTDGVGYIAGLQQPPTANAAYSSSSPQLMLQRKRSVNVNHLHSYHTQGSVPSDDPGVTLDLFHSDQADSSRSHLEHTSPDLEGLGSYFPVHPTSLDQFSYSLGFAEMHVDSNQTNYYCYSNLSLDQNLYPVSFAKNTTDSKLLDSSMSGVRSAERSIELNTLHSSYHLNPSAFQSLSVRSAERSIESSVWHSYHSDPSPYQSMSVRSPERSLESNESQNSELLNINASTQVINFNPSMSDVRRAERSMELNQLYSYHFHPSASKLHPAGLSEGSLCSNVLESNYSVQNGNLNLFISDMRSAERSLVLVLN